MNSIAAAKKVSAERIRERRKQAGQCGGCGKRPPAIDHVTCQPCLDYGKAWHAARPNQSRDSARRGRLRRVGLTEEDYQRVLGLQQGACAICRKQTPRLHLDHDHTTGRFRALLCFACNAAIGLFVEDVALLHKAAEYLIYHKAPPTQDCYS